MRFRTPRTSEFRRPKAGEVLPIESSTERPKVEMRKILEPYLSQLIGEANLDSRDEVKQKEAAHGLAYLALLFPEKALATSKLNQYLTEELESDKRPDYSLEFILAQLFPGEQLRNVPHAEEDIQNIEAGLYPTSCLFHLFLMVRFPEQKKRWDKLLEQQIEKEVAELTMLRQPGESQSFRREEMTLMHAALVVLVKPAFKHDLQQAMEKRMGWSKFVVEQMKNRILRQDPISETLEVAFALEVVFGDTIQGIDTEGRLVYKNATPKINRPLPERALT